MDKISLPKIDLIKISIYLTTSRQSASSEVRKYSSAGRSWHNSSVFGSSSSSSSFWRLTRLLLAATKKKKSKEKWNYWISFIIDQNFTIKNSLSINLIRKIMIFIKWCRCLRFKDMSSEVCNTTRWTITFSLNDAIIVFSSFFLFDCVKVIVNTKRYNKFLMLLILF